MPIKITTSQLPCVKGTTSRSISGFKIELETDKGKNHNTIENRIGIEEVAIAKNGDTAIPLIVPDAIISTIGRNCLKP